LTGAEPTPVMFGGSASLEDAGLYVLSELAMPKYSVPFGLFIRSPIVAYLCLLGLVAASRRRVRTSLATAALVWAGPVLLVQAAPLRPAPVFSTFDAIGVDSGQTLRYSVDLGEPYLAALEGEIPSTASVRFMIWGLQPPFETRVLTGDGELLAQTADGSMFVAAGAAPEHVWQALARSRRITVEISVDRAGHSTTVFGWQRAGLPGRTPTMAPGSIAWGRPVVPALEVWSFDDRGRPLLVGF
jgi:hypothetical protein